MKTYKELIGANYNLVSFFRASPLSGVKINASRDKSNMHDVVSFSEDDCIDF